MRKELISSGLAFVLFLWGCKGKEPAPIPPKQSKLYISIKQNGQYLADSVLNQVKLAYYDNGLTEIAPNRDPGGAYDILLEKQYLMHRVNNFTVKLIPGLLSSSTVLEVINKYDINEFYLLYPDGGRDTLRIAMDKVSKEEADKERCKCLNPIRSVSYRGKKALEDTTIRPELSADPPVFLIER